MFRIGPLHTAREEELQARVPFAIIVDVAEDRREIWPIGPRIQHRMKLPIQLAPGTHMVGTLKFANIHAKNFVRLSKICLS